MEEKRNRALRNLFRARDGVFITYTNNQVFIVALAPKPSSQPESYPSAETNVPLLLHLCYMWEASSTPRSHIQTHTGHVYEKGEAEGSW